MLSLFGWPREWVVRGRLSAKPGSGVAPDTLEDPLSTLPNDVRRRLIAVGASLKPVVHVGQAGIHDAIVRKLDDELRAHELVKVRVLPMAPEDAPTLAPALAEAVGAVVVHRVGRVVLLYREQPAEEEDPSSSA